MRSYNTERSRILSYELRNAGIVSVIMPMDGAVMSVARNDNGSPVLFVKGQVFSDGEMDEEEEALIAIVNTGESVPEGFESWFIGTLAAAGSLRELHIFRIWRPDA